MVSIKEVSSSSKISCAIFILYFLRNFFQYKSASFLLYQILYHLWFSFYRFLQVCRHCNVDHANCIHCLLSKCPYPFLVFPMVQSWQMKIGLFFLQFQFLLDFLYFLGFLCFGHLIILGFLDFYSSWLAKTSRIAILFLLSVWWESMNT